MPCFFCRKAAQGNAALINAGGEIWSLRNLAPPAPSSADLIHGFRGVVGAAPYIVGAQEIFFILRKRKISTISWLLLFPTKQASWGPH